MKFPKIALAVAVVLVAASPAMAQTHVANEAELRSALGNPAVTSIVFDANITLTTGDLPSIAKSVAIDGSGHTLSGGSQFRGLIVGDFAGTGAVNVAISNLNISDTLARGGDGGSGSLGGGGGAGLGGALLVGIGGNVTLSNVNLASNHAVGGNGGAGTGGDGGSGGGGGVGGNGGAGTATAGGGGGGVGVGANGGSQSAGGAGIATGGQFGGPGGVGVNGGDNGGGGGSAAGSAGAGGGVAGNPPVGSNGGQGGDFGGGGGGALGAGNGGSGILGGGGGGGTGGFGGFGGGGGGGASALPSGGLAGGSGADGVAGRGGGGGAGLGGGLFVQEGGSITVTGPLTINGNAVTGGQGAGGGGNGQGFGSGIFLQGFGSLSGGITFAPGAGSTVQIGDRISDEQGVTGDPDSGTWQLNKSGAGTLVLSGTNTYSGGTAVSDGTLQVSGSTNLGSGDVTLSNSATLAITAGGTFSNGLVLAQTPVVNIAGGQTVSATGVISDLVSTPGRLEVAGGGTLVLAGPNPNTYSGGTLVRDNSTLVVSSDAALGGGLSVGLGDTSTGGTLAFTGGAAIASSRAVALNGGGGTLDLRGTDVSLGGAITGSGSLTKKGTGTLSLSNTNTYTGATLVNEGVLQANSNNALGVNSAVTVASGATLTLNNTAQAIGSLAGTGNVTFLGAINSLTVGGDNSDTNFAGNITGAGGATGSGGLTKVGLGALRLSGTTNYSGTTTVSAGTLIGTTASLRGAITNNARVVFDSTTSGTYAGVMTGSGVLAATGPGILTLTGANTYGGGTEISGNGTVAVSADANLGTGAVRLGDATTNGTLSTGTSFTMGRAFTLNAGGGTLDTQGSSVLTANGVFSGAGGLTKTGTGTLVLGGTNTYTGATRIAGGTLLTSTSDALGSNSALTIDAPATLNTGTFAQTVGSLAGAGRITLGSQLTAGTDGTSTTFSGDITGGAAGSLVKTGGGTLTLTGTNSYLGGTTVNGGTLAGNTTSLQGAILNNARVQFDQAAAGTYAGVMNGTGSLLKTGAGSLTLTGANSYSGGTTVSGGALIGTTTSVQGNVINDALVVFNQGTAGTYAGTMSGTGALAMTGGGTLTLTGANSHSGGTLISGNSTIVVGADANLGAATGGVAIGDGTSAGTLRFLTGTLFASTRGFVLGAGGGTFDAQGSSSVTLNGSIGGAGSLTKTGTGTLTLGAFNGYSGGTIVASGTLRAGATGAFGPGTMVLAAGSTLDLNSFSQNVSSLSGAGSILLGSAALTTGGSGASTLFSGNISGTGTLIKLGTGTLTLSGSNSHSGGTFVAGNGAIAITTDDNLGAATGVVGLGDASSAGTLQFGGVSFTAIRGFVLGSGGGIFDTGTTAITLNGSIAGSGGLTKIGTGTLTLGGVNTFAGPTTVTAGTLRAANTNVFGAGVLTIASGATVDLNSFSQTVSSLAGSGNVFLGSGTLTSGVDNTSTTFSGNISGSGGLVKAGAGTLTLTGQNTFTGGTTIAGGILRAGGASSLSENTALTIGAGATLDLNGFSQTFGSIGGAGSLLLGNATVTAGGDNSSTLFSGSIVGGSLVKVGTGSLILTGANSFSGPLTVNGGALVGTTSSLTANINNNALVVFDQGSDGTYTGSITGSGALLKTGTGSLTLTGANAYRGGTTVSAGSLIGTSSSLQGTIVNNASLGFAQSADGVFNGALTGNGSIFKSGLGTLSLNGTHSATGLLTVTQGTVSLNGIFGGSVNVVPGSTFRANGAVAGSIDVAGTLAVVPPPGAAGGAASLLTASTGPRLTTPPFFTVGGNLSAFPGSTIALPIGPGGNPTIAVGGNATLNGTHLDLTATDVGTARAVSFLALTAGNTLSVTNTDAITQSPAFVPVIRQSGQSLFITLLNLTAPLAVPAGTPNRKKVADAIDRVKLGGGEDILKVATELTALDDDGLNDALDQIAGEVYASSLQIAILDSEGFTDLVRDQIASRDRDSRTDRLTWWTEIRAEHGTFEDGEIHGGTVNLGGGAGGFDYRPPGRFFFGGGGGFGKGKMGLDRLAASTDFRAPRAFGYAGFKPKGFGIHGGGSAAKSTSKTERPIQFAATLPFELGAELLTGGIEREATGEETALLSDQWGEYADNFDMSSYRIDFNVGIRHARFGRNGFTETGAGALSLLLPDQNVDLRQTDVKVHVWKKTGDIRPFFQSLFRREMTSGSTTTDLEFAGTPNSRFDVDGIPVPGNTIMAKGGVVLASWLGSLTVEYMYKHAPGEQRQGVSARVRFK